MAKTAILLHNLGGPATLDEVEPFLESLLSDREVIRLPFSRWLQKPIARLITRSRAQEVRERYRMIGGSRLLQWTQAQARGLAMGLREFFPDEDMLVLPAMRHSSPSIEEAVRHAQAEGVERVLSLSLYPQYSMTTVGSSERELERSLQAVGWKPEVVKVSQFHDAEDFHKCWAWRIEKELGALPRDVRGETVIVFSAHGIPMSFVRRGDPYVEQVEGTVAGVCRQLGGGHQYRVAFQSRVGPVAWMRPFVDECVVGLAESGVRSVLVVPLSCVSDHVETLCELDIEVKRTAIAAGIASYARCRSLNADPDFLAVLTRLARDALAG